MCSWESVEKSDVEKKNHSSPFHDELFSTAKQEVENTPSQSIKRVDTSRHADSGELTFHNDIYSSTTNKQREQQFATADVQKNSIGNLVQDEQNALLNGFINKESYGVLSFGSAENAKPELSALKNIEANKSPNRVEEHSDGSVVTYENHRPVRAVDTNGTVFTYRWEKVAPGEGSSNASESWHPTYISMTDSEGKNRFEFRWKDPDRYMGLGGIKDLMTQLAQIRGLDFSTIGDYKVYLNGKEFAPDDNVGDQYPKDTDVFLHVKPDGSLSIDEASHDLLDSLVDRHFVHDYRIDGSYKRHISSGDPRIGGVDSPGKNKNYDFVWNFDKDGKFYYKTYVRPEESKPKPNDAG